MTQIRLDRRIRMDLAERNDNARIVAALLAHLAAGRLCRVGVFRVDHPAGNLKREVADTVAVLPNHHHITFRRNWDDIDPSWHGKNIEVALATMRVRRLTPMEVEDRRTVDALGYERLPSACFHGQSCLTSPARNREMERPAT